MSDTKFAAFQQKIKTDPALLAQVKSVTSVGEFVAICNAHGIKITQAELMKSQAERILKLSDAELESAHITAAMYSTDTAWGCLTWALGCTCSANPGGC